MAAPQPAWGDVYEMPDNITADDLLRLPDDGAKNELYEGVLVREMTSPGHGDICQRLGGLLFVYTQATGFPNRIVQNALFDLTPPAATRKTVLAPDVAIMRSGTAPSWNVPQYVPLLAIEVVSESQTVAVLALKAQFYRTAGTDEVWVVDHKTRAIEVWDAEGRHSLDETRTLTTPLLPGSSLSVRALLDG